MILTMIKLVLLIVGIEFLCVATGRAQELNTTDTTENQTEIFESKPFIYYGRYHQRPRREDSFKNTTSELDVIATVVSILPLDRLGAILGQIMATSLAEIFNSNVGKKLVEFLEKQVPTLLTSIFANLVNTLRVQTRSVTNNTTVSINKNNNKLSSNSSTFSLTDFMRRPRTK